MFLLLLKEPSRQTLVVDPTQVSGHTQDDVKLKTLTVSKRTRPKKVITSNEVEPTTLLKSWRFFSQSSTAWTLRKKMERRSTGRIHRMLTEKPLAITLGHRLLFEAL